MPFSRRELLAGSVALPASAMQSAKPADIQDAKAPRERRILQSRWTQDRLHRELLPANRWQPFPRAVDRPAWSAVPEPLRAELAPAAWPHLPATLFLEYVRTGNRSRFERVQRERRNRLKALVLAECARAKGEYVEQIADAVWSTCEETFWGYPAHLSLQKSGPGLPDVSEPVIDLFAAETGALLAWTGYLLGPQLDRVHEGVRRRIHSELDRRILTPFLSRDDFWWMGLEAERPMNNWNPWINSNCLTCALLSERDPARRTRLVHKVLRSLDRFLDSYGEDGGCDEGPGYWGHAGGALFIALELLDSASSGKVNFFDVRLIKEIGRYIVRVNIAGNWYVNFADASARVNIDGPLVYRYGKHIEDPHMQALGAWATKGKDVTGESIGRILPAIFDKTLAMAPAGQPLVRDVWLADIQVMAARSKAGSSNGFYIAAQGGHNAESHNHNDVGNFLVFRDGSPVLIDIGVETYTAKTFSSKRYEIWTMQSAYHNLPTINGAMQSAGRAFAARNVACRSSDAVSELRMDIAGAYPSEAAVETWTRTLRLDRTKDTVTIEDAWRLQPGPVEWTFMTAAQPAQLEPGILRVSPGVKLLHDATMTARIEEIGIEDERLKNVWGSRIYRVLIAAPRVPASGTTAFRLVSG